MALPVVSIQSIPWQRYQGQNTDLIFQTTCDFTAASAYIFQTTGTIPTGSTSNPNQGAAGLGIDNTGNMNNVAVTVGAGPSQYVENIPPYSKSVIQIGGSNTFVKIAGNGGNCLATFYTGEYPGGLGQQNVLAATTQAIGVFLPSGMVMMFAGPEGNIPAGWLLCDGSAVSRTVYSSLYAAIGTAYGAGDGISTFNLPPLKDTSTLYGRVPVGGGATSTIGQDIGEDTHVLSVGEMPSHRHVLNDSNGFNAAAAGGSAPYSVVSGPVTSISEVALSSLSSSATGGGGGHNNIQPSVIMRYIIKT